jgi:hyperosmotically inducible protein
MKTKKNILVAVVIVMIAAFGLAACETPAGRSAGEVVDDGTITTKVKAKLFDDDQLSGFAISVETFEGGVTLTGAVDSAAEKQRATNIARSVKGVKSVNNLLKIKK